MQIIDFILGKKLANNYIRTIYIRRFELPDEGLDSLLKICTIIHNELTAAWKNVNGLPYNIDTVMRALGDLINKLQGGVVVDQGLYKNLREILSLFSSMNYEIHLIKRVDLQTADYKPGAKAYLIDMNDVLYPALNRVSNGYGINFPIVQDASLPNVVMQFIKTTINLDETTKQLIGLLAMSEQYEALAKVNAGWQFNIDPLLSFLNDYGYKFIVCLDS